MGTKISVLTCGHSFVRTPFSHSTDSFPPVPGVCRLWTTAQSAPPPSCFFPLPAVSSPCPILWYPLTPPSSPTLPSSPARQESSTNLLPLIAFDVVTEAVPGTVEVAPPGDATGDGYQDGHGKGQTETAVDQHEGGSDKGHVFERQPAHLVQKYSPLRRGEAASGGLGRLLGGVVFRVAYRYPFSQSARIGGRKKRGGQERRSAGAQERTSFQ